MTSLPVPTPTPSQAAQIQHALHLLDQGRYTVTFAGPAGSGKTFCLLILLAELRRRGKTVAVVAPTGKAARRAQESTGKPASTIHSFVYQTVIDEEDEDGRITPTFRSPCVEEPPDVLVIDEGSMVGTRVARDVEIALRGGKDDLSIPRRTQILVVGDNAQLPPVKDTWGYPLHAPDAQLTEVLRQAADSPVLRMATRIRTSHDPADWLRTDAPDDDRLQVRRQIQLADAAAWVRDAPDQRIVLAYTNNTRRALNALVRAPWAGDGALVGGKDRLVCMANSSRFVNGDIVPVQTAARDHESEMRLRGHSDVHVYRLTVPDPVNGSERAVRVAPVTLGGNPVDVMLADGRMKRGMTAAEARRKSPIVPLWHADYGFALTIHKSQGSQWPEVMVLVDDATARLVQRNRNEAQRLLYTACTRASERLIVGRLA